MFPFTSVCFFILQKPLATLCLLTFSSLWTPGIPSLDVILESARDDMNVAKKLMVSVATNPAPAIARSRVGSQVPHLKSLPVLFWVDTEYIWEHHVLTRQ